MMLTVNISGRAQEDLHSIYKYIAYELKTPQNAAGQLSRLEKAIFSLKQFPERFRLYGKEPWKSRNLRIMPVDNYIVFYIPQTEDGTVTVIRVIYSGRDTDGQLDTI